MDKGIDNNAQRRMENGRLVYYAKAANTTYWDNFWGERRSSEWYERAEKGKLPWWLDQVIHYLPRPGRILEAGCGLGQHVLALCHKGYDAEGVDWGMETVETVKSLYPDLPIRQGDVTQLDVNDGFYAGYISLGVVEHRKEGPEPYLKEAHRVLETGGTAFISVPYINRLRQLKASLGLYRGQPDDLDFYQYAFTKNQFRRYLLGFGFEVIEEVPYGSISGLMDEIPLLRSFFLLGKGNKILRLAMNTGRGFFDDSSSEVIEEVPYDSVEGLKEENLPLRLLFKKKVEKKLRLAFSLSLGFMERNFANMILFVCRKI
jgi:SAM-dependent methyltransferase